LISLGHRRIAHLAAERHLSTSRDRLSGYLAALESAGVARDDALIVEGSYEAERSRLEAGIDRLLSLSRPPTALFASSDWIAAGAVHILRSRGLSVPDDMAVIGYGNQSFSSLFDLTTVDQNPAEMGLAAASRLFERMAHPEMPVQATALPTELVIRGSCGACAAL
jgi:LacI family transcriptional regulator